MKTVTITRPELFMVAGTRGLLGAGIALLLGERLSREQRYAVGWTLALVGALSTIPLATEVLGAGALRAAAGELPARVPRRGSKSVDEAHLEAQAAGVEGR